MIEKKAMVPAFMELTPLWERTDICQQNHKRQCTMTTSNTAMQERTWVKKACNRTDAEAKTRRVSSILHQVKNGLVGGSIF